ncbi:MAG: tetratricopeptide repeat protein, partial [Planctomycetales bacterium]|nr:tetratricopeptide repeat protein [Planctomycetales bacterium]
MTRFHPRPPFSPGKQCPGIADTRQIAGPGRERHTAPSRRHPPSVRARRSIGWTLLVATIGFHSSANLVCAQLGTAHPSQGYYAAFGQMYRGEYASARKTFESAARSGVRSVDGRWIDSVCYYAMLGECYYQEGDLASALTNFEAALGVFANQPAWMRVVQFPDTIAPSARKTTSKAVPWGNSARNVPVGDFPRRMQILRGRLDNSDVVQQGGVVQ